MSERLLTPDAMSPLANNLIGIGLYSPAEAGSLISVAPSRLGRWLRGHDARGQHYAALWEPEIELEDETLCLSFRDLLEARAVDRFIKLGLSPQKVRRAIALARAVVGDRPLSTTWLRTDGARVFLQTVQEDGGEPELLDLFKNQFAFNAVVAQTLKDLDFEDRAPTAWWPLGRKAGVLIDPHRAFGQPIEYETSIPAATLAMAATAEGSAEAAARIWRVRPAAVRRAVNFQRKQDQKKAA